VETFFLGSEVPSDLETPFGRDGNSLKKCEPPFKRDGTPLKREKWKLL
jgi:hypothetical protein